MANAFALAVAESGKTDKDFAELIGVDSHDRVRRWRSNKTVLPMLYGYRAAKAVGRTVEDLITAANTPQALALADRVKALEDEVSELRTGYEHLAELLGSDHRGG
jgi:hypothetical protein